MDLMARYERAHQHSLNRWIHHFAHALAVTGGIMALVGPWWALAFVPLALPISWAGHYLFEKNRPPFFAAPPGESWLAGVIRRIEVALGGIVWSARCLWRGAR